jgi:hypothetical protein
MGNLSSNDAPSSPDDMRRVTALVGAQGLAVLATRGADGAPYTSLVALAASADGWDLGFCTRRATQKHENLMAEPRVALLVDDRRGGVDNLKVSTALTAVGVAHDVGGPERERWERALLAAHPSLADLLRSPDCALFRVDVSRYLLVSQLERVVELRRPTSPERTES